MRASTGILGGISIFFVGFFALASAADESRDAAVTNGTNASESAWNMSTGVFEGVGQAAGPGIIWMGVAAFILIALGLLAFSMTGGR